MPLATEASEKAMSETMQGWAKENALRIDAYKVALADWRGAEPNDSIVNATEEEKAAWEAARQDWRDARPHDAVVDAVIADNPAAFAAALADEKIAETVKAEAAAKAAKKAAGKAADNALTTNAAPAILEGAQALRSTAGNVVQKAGLKASPFATDRAIGLLAKMARKLGKVT